MQEDEPNKLKTMNSQEACELLLSRIGGIIDIINHLNDSSDIQSFNTDISMCRLRGYLSLLEAEATLVLKLIMESYLKETK